ncbi:protein RRNAD1-like isoform X2 [Zootermopsis nevadensis]|uniref:protein RRNAD1-like isoform X2 n=1 Tax=Zootermopsis nevadensis TaxID=136037 RepID=UPI000B8EC347|nr:protein RRNAD1-like isoform X2 [Zootermopsis nevadensis]
MFCAVLFQDYFTDCHWNKLPLSWRRAFDTVEPQELGQFLTQNSTFKSCHRVWPLSFLALYTTSLHLSIPREQIHFEDLLKGQKQFDDGSSSLEEPNLIYRDVTFNRKSSVACAQMPGLKHPKLQYAFRKHVKPKKQHEISRMAQVTASVAQSESCHYVVDVGSGLGHLARLLAYGYGLKVCCLEAQENLSSQARKLDMELEASVSKILKDDGFEVNWPVHLSIAVDSRLTASSFTEALKIAFGISGEHFTFGMVGLHPCGDLTPILMHLFVQCPNAKFINIVGCCYMKLTTGVISGFTGYPMSDFISARPHSLSYEAREIACHAIETYCQRLCLGQYDDLKVHCYRAALEKILVKYWPHLRHTMIKSIKHTNNMTFTQYITLAFINLGLEVPVEDLESEETQLDLSQWKRVVIFYTLRLILAPVVETVLLLDRLLYLQELGIRSDLIPVFDPSLSPRNSILIGRK